MNKHLCLLSIACILAASMLARPNHHGLIPYPSKVVEHRGEARLPRLCTVSVSHSDFAVAAELLGERLQNDLSLTVRYSNKDNATIRFLLDRNIASPEGYHLAITHKGITIKASDVRGARYGAFTLARLMYHYRPVGMNRVFRLPLLQIEDSPRFEMRALLLDPARNFLPVADVEGFIDRMSYYKFNTLHLHLTDDQGWRVQIATHPKLTEASKRFYTADELRHLVRYAARRGVEIIPEVDVPGHTAAMLIAYPDLRCDFLKDSVFVLGKTDNVMLSAANERTYQVLDDVLRELANIFPKGARIHLGGDESAIERNWAKSAEHRLLMQRLQMDNPRQLMAYFFNRVLASARNYGFRPMLWAELDNVRMPAREYLFNYPKDVELITWRWGLTPKCIELTRQTGHRLLLAPGEQAYLDYPQWRGDLPELNNWGMPVTPLQRSYCFDLDEKLYQAGDEHIMGVMGTLWAEAIPSIHRAYYMAYPRALALAEVGWTPLAQRSWERFREALPSVLHQLTLSGVPYRVPFEVYERK